MNWFKKIFKHRLTPQEETDEIIKKRLAECQSRPKVFCKDCTYCFIPPPMSTMISGVAPDGRRTTLLARRNIIFANFKTATVSADGSRREIIMTLFILAAAIISAWIWGNR
jgi:hypothetical protein